MDEKQIREMVAQLMGDALKTFRDELKPAMESAGTVKTELDAMRRQAMVQERLAACKLAPEDTTPALLTHLASIVLIFVELYHVRPSN